MVRVVLRVKLLVPVGVALNEASGVTVGLGLAVAEGVAVGVTVVTAVNAEWNQPSAMLSMA